MTKSYEYTDDAGRVLCWVHDRIRCGDCRYIDELEKELQLTEKSLEGFNKAYEKVKQQNKRYREVIKFYANEDNWNEKDADSGNCMTDYESKAVLDGGYKARKAMEDDEE